MSGPEAAWIVIVAGGILTFLVRASFVAFAHRLTEVPPVLTEALRMIPPAALAALTVPAMLRTGGELDLVSARSIAGLIAAIIAFRTKNVIATMAVGLVAVFLLSSVAGL